MSVLVCPECAQGKCINCTGEVIESATDMPLECPCDGASHRLDPLHHEHHVLRVLDASAAVGGTVPELRGILGLRRPGVALARLAADGLAVRLSETRSGWPVYVTAHDVQGRQIAFPEEETDQWDQYPFEPDPWCGSCSGSGCPDCKQPEGNQGG